MSKEISEQSVPVQEIKTPTVVSVKKFMKSVLVVLLSFICICVGVLIYQLHADFHPVYKDRNKTEKESVIPLKGKKVVAPAIKKKAPLTFVEPKASQVTKSIKTADNELPLILESPMISVPPKPEKTEAENTIVPEDKSEAKEITVKPTVVETESVLPLSVVLNLRDKLIMGETCGDELKQLISEKLPGKADKTKILNVLLPICTDTSAFDELKTTFNQEKKSAWTTYYRMTNSSKWVAYMKAIGTTLVDVRRLNPVKKRPKDLVSLAQNALNQYNVSEAVILVQKLPPEMQADFRGFLGQANAYILAQEAVDSLVFSYEKGDK